MADETETDKDKPLTEEVIEVEDGIDELKKKLEESEQKRLAAEADARGAREHANKASATADSALDAVDQSHLSVISGAIEKIKSDQENFKVQYASAMAEGNFAAAADVQLAMATAAAQLLNLENGKIAIETKPKREAAERARASDDPVEKLAVSLTAASGDWVRRHPEYARDPAKYKKMLAAHYDAIAENKDPDSADYFAHVETKLGLRKPAVAETNGHDTVDPLSAAAAPAVREVPPPAAPASRGSTRPGAMRLSEQQKEAAKISGITEEEYAKNLAAERARAKAQVH